MFNKELLMPSTSNVPSGFVKALLTIGSTHYSPPSDLDEWYAGFRSSDADQKNPIGSLEPTNGYGLLCVTYYTLSGEDPSKGYYIECTKPFYYNGILYTTSTDDAIVQQLYNEWLQKNGQTVEVFVSA